MMLPRRWLYDGLRLFAQYLFGDIRVPLLCHQKKRRVEGLGGQHNEDRKYVIPLKELKHTVVCHKKYVTVFLWL